MRTLVTALILTILISPLTQAAEKRMRGVTLGEGISTSDLDDLSTWKANLVRFEFIFHITGDTATREEYLAWLDTEIAELDALLPTLASHGMKVIIDLYTPPGGFVSHEAPALHRLFAESWAQSTYIEAWQKIASHYAGNSTIWGYDLLNEPAQRSVASGLLDWNALAKQAALTVRTYDSKQKIIIEPIYGDQARFGRLKPPRGVRGVVYSIHLYYPLYFQHQGMYGNPIGVLYPKGKLNKGAILKNLKGAIKFQEKYKAQIYVGEFSAPRWAPQNSAYNYLRDAISLFEKLKWHWTYQAFRGYDGWSLEHTDDPNDTARASTPTNRALLVKSYFAKNK